MAVGLLFFTLFCTSCLARPGPSGSVSSPDTPPSEPIPGDPQTPEPLPNPDPTPPPAPGRTLSELDILTRASLDVRGHRPSLSELQQIEAQPDSFEQILVSFVDSPGFGVRIRDIFARRLRTRTESYILTPEIPIRSEDDTWRAREAIAEETLALLEYVAVNDRPWTEILTADYTFLQEILATNWPVSGYDSRQGGTQRVQYNDGRPAAGILSSNAFYYRYPNGATNFNRGRANAVSRILLCENYLERPIDFPRNLDLTNQEVIDQAIDTNPGCIACHSSLDPLASHFFGFAQGDPRPNYEAVDETLWEIFTQRRPGFYGSGSTGLASLATQIANDPRFRTCTVRQVYEAFLGRQATRVDDTAIAGHKAAFEEGGLRMKALVRSILQDPVYRGSADNLRSVVDRKLIAPEILQTAIEDLTGFVAHIDGRDLLRNDERGLHVLGGGLSARSGDAPPTSPSIPRVLTYQRVAEMAAVWAATHPHSARALSGIDPQAGTPNRSELQNIYMRVLGRPPSTPELDSLSALVEELQNLDLNSTETWAATLSSVLRSPEFVTY